DNWILKGNVFYKVEEVCLPLYEGKMISYFDHRFNSYNQGRVAQTYELSDTQHADPLFLTMPRYWIHESYMPSLVSDGRKAFLAFRNIARSTDNRTAIFSIIPVTACGDKLPIIALNPNCIREVTYLAACF